MVSFSIVLGQYPNSLSTKVVSQGSGSVFGAVVSQDSGSVCRKESNRTRQ